MAVAIGIDPASGKETCIWMDNNYSFVKAQKVRETIAEIVNKHPDSIIAWDAPISFSQSSYSDRKIDKVTRAWVKERVSQGILEKSSVNALPFSGLSHWVISCEALGLPFGVQQEKLSLYKSKEFHGESGSHVIEVHPAVSMACLWMDKEMDSAFPVYKKSRESRQCICENLGFPSVCVESDDILDSYVAYLMAEWFIKGKAGSLGQPEMGSYVLPSGGSYNELNHRMG